MRARCPCYLRNRIIRSTGAIEYPLDDSPCWPGTDLYRGASCTPSSRWINDHRYSGRVFHPAADWVLAEFASGPTYLRGCRQLSRYLHVQRSKTVPSCALYLLARTRDQVLSSTDNLPHRDVSRTTHQLPNAVCLIRGVPQTVTDYPASPIDPVGRMDPGLVA